MVAENQGRLIQVTSTIFEKFQKKIEKIFIAGNLTQPQIKPAMSFASCLPTCSGLSTLRCSKIQLYQMLVTRIGDGCIRDVGDESYLYENQNTCQQLFVAFLLEYIYIFLQQTVVLLHRGFFDPRSASRPVRRSPSFVTICYSENIRNIFISQIIKFPNILKLPILISFSGLTGLKSAMSTDD